MAAKLRFGLYELDCGAMELRKEGLLIRLQEQPLRVLIILVERAGEIIPREELQKQIWGNTFVEYDQSLNRTVNRIREALQDDAGNPRFVETIPRRGYRFIAPVATIPLPGAAALPDAPLHPVSVAEPALERRFFSSRIVLLSAIALTALTAIAFTTVAWLRRPPKAALQEARHMTSSGYAPVLSRDGKLLAYASGGGGVTSHIWVQQTAGGETIPIDTGSDSEDGPEFSPDGTHIAFFSAKNGGGIYIAPTMPGEPRLLLAISGAFSLRFSPNGDHLLYGSNRKVFTISAEGGPPVSLPVNQKFQLYGEALWAPNGNEILFFGVRSSAATEPPVWWIAPVAGEDARQVHIPDVNKNVYMGQAVREWQQNTDGSEWIIYATADFESWKLWRVGISPQGVTDEKAELLAHGTGWLGPGGSVLEGGAFAYNLWGYDSSIYQVSIGEHGQTQGPTLQLPLRLGGSSSSPSVSREGEWLAYDSNVVGKANTIMLRNLDTGADHIVDEKGRRFRDLYETSISPDGSRVAFERDCKDGSKFPDDNVTPFPCSFIVAASGGLTEQICGHCTPRGFSSDGSVVLFQQYDEKDTKKDRVVALDLRTGKKSDFLSLPDRGVYHPFFSWDDRWVVFKKMQPEHEPLSQIMIAPVRDGVAAGESEWIAITDGLHADDKPQFSADGKTVYFTSSRDEYLCIWAQRLNPSNRHPLGAPFVFEHFHTVPGQFATSQMGSQDLSIARDKILLNLPLEHSDIWIMQTR